MSDFMERLKNHAPCDCNLCQYSRHISAVKERGDIEEMRKLIEELSENLWNTGEELSMVKAELEDVRTGLPEGVAE